MSGIVVYQDGIDKELDTYTVRFEFGCDYEMIEKVITRKDLKKFRDDIDAILAKAGELGE